MSKKEHWTAEELEAMKSAKRSIEIFLDCIKENLRDGKPANIKGFGVFKMETSETKKTIVFKPSPKLIKSITE